MSKQMDLVTKKITADGLSMLIFERRHFMANAGYCSLFSREPRLVSTTAFRCKPTNDNILHKWFSAFLSFFLFDTYFENEI
jgi:hypothetical protein